MMQTAIKSLGAGATDIEAVTAAVQELNVANTATVLSTTALSEADQIAILMSHGLSEAEAQEALAAASASTSTGVLATIQGVATTATTSLATAFKGLWATLMANPIILIVAAIAGLVAVINNVANAAEEASEKYKELADTALEKTQSLDEERNRVSELISEYEELASSGDIDADTRIQIRDIQKEINSLVGDEASGLDLVNGKLDEQLLKLKQAELADLKNNQSDYIAAYSSAAKSADNAYVSNRDDAGWAKWAANLAGIDLIVDEYDEAAKDILNTVDGVNASWDSNLFNSFLDINFDADSAQEYYDIITNCIKALEDDADFYHQDSDVYNYLVSLREEYNAFIDTLDTATKELVNNTISIEGLELDIDGNIVDSIDSYKEYKDKLVDAVWNSDDLTEVIADGKITQEQVQELVNDQMALDYSDLYNEITKAEKLAEKRKEVLESIFNDDYIKNNLSGVPSSEIENAKKALESEIAMLSDEDLEIACELIATTDIGSFSELEEAIANYEPEEKISFSDLLAEEDTDDADSFKTKVDSYVSQVTKLQDALDDLKDNDFSDADFVELVEEFPELADNADDLESAINELVGSMNSDIVEEFSSQFNRLETDEDVDALQAFMDAVLELGKVVGSTEFSIDIEAETNGMENLWTAMKESVSSTGLTTESISNLKARYSELEKQGYDVASMFEKTENGVHLNTKALRKLESAYEEQKKLKIDSSLEDLVKRYNDLTEEINKAKDATSTADLYAQRADILDQINDTTILAAQYEGLTSAFYKWEQAQSIGEEGDMYDSLAGSLEDIKELYDEGLIGTNQFRTAVQLMSNEDLSTASIDELLAAYESGYNTMTRYFTDSSDGCLNFLNDLQNLNSEWVSMNSDGSWNINFGMGNDQEIADALGINVESIQAIMRKLSDYGFDINLDSIYSNLDLLQSYAEKANDALKEIGATEYTFNFETNDLDYVKEQIEEAESLLNSMYNNDGELNVNYNESDLENAQTVLTALISQRQALEAPAIMDIDTTAISEADSEISNAIGSLQEFIQYSNDLEIETALGVDTSETQQKLQEVSSSLNELPDEVKTQVGIDDEAFQTTLQNIIGTEVNVETGVGINEEDIASIQTKINSIDPNDIEILTNSEAVLGELTSVDEYTIDDKDFSVTVQDYATSRMNAINSYVIKNKTYTITAQTRTTGSGSAQGTAYASGDWGTKNSGMALGGEVGEELIVRKGRFFTIGEDSAEFFNYKRGDIIFNAEQTRQILANGKITNGKRRGVSYAEGTAFSSGSGKITGSGSVRTTSSSSSSSSSSGSSSTDEDEPEVFDWIEVAIDRIERAINKLKTTAESTYKALKTKLGATADEITKVNEELELQQKAYNRYIQQANSVGLSSDLAEKVRNGTVDISEYDSDTQDLIQDYQEWYEKALDCDEAIQQLHEDLAALYEDNFNNIQTDFENQLSLLEHLTNTYETGIDALEAKGYLESTKYYSALQDVEKKNLAALNSELSSLTQAFSDAMTSGEIEEYSEAWYSMQIEINGVKEAIDEANLSLLEYAKTMREIEWGYFDYVEDRISQITSEADFLIDLMSNSDLYTDKGQLTDEGMATMGLHAQNYNVYMAQADQYAEEILALDKEIANDPYNTDLIERREELLGLQQDSILAAEDEKQAIVDLVEEGIDIELQALQDLIDAYTDSLDSAKDLYEYQKKIEEKTADIATLQKQLSAYENDTSEETRAKIQQIKVDLSEAEADLAETEYEQFVTDAKKLLDNLYDEYEMILNERLDNVDLLLSDMIDSVNQSSADISDTLQRVSDEVGYTITQSLQDIWSNDGGANSIITKYGDSFTSQLTSVNQVLSSIQANVASMVSASDSEATATTSGTTTTTTPTAPSNSNTTSNNAQTTTSTGGTTFTENVKKGVAAAIWIYGGSKSGWGNDPDRKKKLTAKFGSSNATAIQSYINAHGTNGDLYKYWVNSGKSNLSQYYYSAFKTGGLADYTGMAWLDGTPTKPELVLNAQDTENFLQLRDMLSKMSQNTLTFSNSGYSSVGSAQLNGLTDISGILDGISVRGNQTDNSIGEINITIPIDHVDDYDDFVNKFITDKRFQNIVQDMSVNLLGGGSTLAKYKHIR